MGQTKVVVILLSSNRSSMYRKVRSHDARLNFEIHSNGVYSNRINTVCNNTRLNIMMLD